MTGTYVEFPVTNSTQVLLNKWLGSLDIPVETVAHHFHVTTVYSRIPIDYTPITQANPITIFPPELSLMFLSGNNDLGLCLCLGIHNQVFIRSHKRAMQLGAIWDYPSFIPHLTLTYNTKLEDLIAKPITLPQFHLTFESESVMPLDESWKPVRG